MVSENLTSLMKKKYGVERSTPLIFTDKDTLYTSYRKLADNIYKNGDWTEDDLQAAAHYMMEMYYSNRSIDNLKISSIQRNEIQFALANVVGSQLKIPNPKPFFFNISFETNGKKFERTDAIFIDESNKSGTKHNESYAVRKDEVGIVVIGNANRAIGYHKLAKDLSTYFDGRSDEVRKEGALLIERLSSALYSGKKNEMFFTKPLEASFTDEFLSTLPRSESHLNKYSEDDVPYMLKDGGSTHFLYPERIAKARIKAEAIEIVSSYMEETYDIILQQEYDKDIEKQTRAAAWETKKNINKNVQDVMETTSLNEYFRFIEIDNDVDLEKFEEFEKEMSRVLAVLPSLDVQPTLRLRKLGNYHALGLFNPATKTIAIDFRSDQDKFPSKDYENQNVGIQSFIHEYGHYLDYNSGSEQLSLTKEFRKIVIDYRENIKKLPSESLVSFKPNYYGTPTEVFARAFELYVSEAELETPLNHIKSVYETRDDYTAFSKESKARIKLFFDKQFPDLSNNINKLMIQSESSIIDFNSDKVTNLIESIGGHESGYYLWHEFELRNLGASDEIVEKFHNEIPLLNFPMANMTVEESANNGASGYLALNGLPIDKDNLREWVKSQTYSSQLELENYLTELEKTVLQEWNKVSNIYDKCLEDFVLKNQIAEQENITSESPEITSEPVKVLESTVDTLKEKCDEKVRMARSRDILDVANQLGIDLKRVGGNSYQWTEHDSFYISSDKNLWNWFSESTGGDVISLVQQFKNINFNQAIDFLVYGKFKENPIKLETNKIEPFNNYLAPFEVQDLTLTRTFLQEVRGLSKETVDFFLSTGKLSQVTHKTGTLIEPIILFKTIDNKGTMAGGSLQGIESHPEVHDRGRLKKIMKNSDGMDGFSVDIGTPNRLIFCEAPIDLMSYYELHKERLENVRLVAMDGLKEATISRHFAILGAELRGVTPETDRDKLKKILSIQAKVTDFFKRPENSQYITLAIDNDEAAIKFIEKLESKGIAFKKDLPPITGNQRKNDWNDYLIEMKEENMQKDSNLPDRMTFISASHSMYENHLVLLAEDETVYIGKRDNYDQKGNYNNLDESLINISQNKKMYSMLQLSQPDISKDEMISNGMRTIEDYRELDNIQQTKLSHLKMNAIMSASLESKEKAPEKAQEQQKNAEGTIGDFPDKQEAAPLPDAIESQPLDDLLPNQTQPQPLLHFTIKEGGMSIDKRHYHNASDKEINKLNRYSHSIQKTAQWYLDNIADSSLIYLYKDGESVSSLTVDFDKDKFLHLTGIYPYKEGQTAEQSLLDFANGRGEFDSILLANKGAAIDKVKVLPELESIIESDTFYFGDLSSVEKLHKLNLDKAIKSGDEDVVLALRTVDETTFPASLMKLREPLKVQLNQSQEEKEIIAVFRKKDGKYDQLSINPSYSQSKGSELKGLLENGDFVINHNKNKDKNIDELILQSDSKGIANYLKKDLKNIFTVDRFPKFIEAIGNLSNYSLNNIQLLQAQNSDVKLVKSFKQWSHNHHLKILKGEKALKIWSSYQTKVRDKNGVENEVTKYKLVPVFDIQQTTGEIKDLGLVNQLDYNKEDNERLFRAIKETMKVQKISFAHALDTGSLSSTFDTLNNQIIFKRGMTPDQTFQAIFREIAILELNQGSPLSVRDETTKYTVMKSEVIAYALASHYQLPKEDYSFEYLTEINDKTKSIEELKDELIDIQTATKNIIQRIDNELEKTKSMNISQDRFQERLESFKEKSEQKELNQNKNRGVEPETKKKQQPHHKI